MSAITQDAMVMLSLIERSGETKIGLAYVPEQDPFAVTLQFHPCAGVSLTWYLDRATLYAAVETPHDGERSAEGAAITVASEGVNLVLTLVEDGTAVTIRKSLLRAFLRRTTGAVPIDAETFDAETFDDAALDAELVRLIGGVV